MWWWLSDWNGRCVVNQDGMESMRAIAAFTGGSEAKRAHPQRRLIGARARHGTTRRNRCLRDAEGGRNENLAAWVLATAAVRDPAGELRVERAPGHGERTGLFDNGYGTGLGFGSADDGGILVCDWEFP